jgi:hypothetical protein
LLNASGRAGRAGFANQGLVIVVPDSPKFFDTPETALEMRRQLSFLEHPDAAIEVLSPLRIFMDLIAEGRFDTDLASPDELVAAAMLVGGGREAPPPIEVLRRTYAAFLRQESGFDEGATKGSERLAKIREDFVSRAGAPDWLPVVAQRAGLDFFSTLRLFQAWKRAVPRLSPDFHMWNTEAWLTAFFETLQYLTPRRVSDLFSFDLTDLPVRMQQAIQTAGNRADSPSWTPTHEWRTSWQQLEKTVRLWMNGNSIKDIAVSLLDLDPGNVSDKRNDGRYPIPKTLAFVSNIIDRLSVLAGGIIAILEEELRTRRLAGEQWPDKLPYELLTFPLALKYGCDSSQTLAWYRFGIRFRRPAHLLNQAFEPDSSIRDDKRLAEAIRDLRSQWLRHEISVPKTLAQEYGGIYDAIETIIKSEVEST